MAYVVMALRSYGPQLVIALLQVVRGAITTYIVMACVVVVVSVAGVVIINVHTHTHEFSRYQRTYVIVNVHTYIHKFMKFSRVRTHT